MASTSRGLLDRSFVATVIAGANVPDQKLVNQTLDAIPIKRPDSTSHSPQHLYLKKGYTGEPVDCQVRQRGYVPHVPRKANEPPIPRA